MKRRILVAEDDELMRAFILTVLTEQGYEVMEAVDGAEALRRLNKEDFDVIISDVKMPGMSGIELMREGVKVRPGAKWIFLTAYGSISEAVSAVRDGAVDYLSKPLESPEQLRHVVSRAIKTLEDEQKIQLLSEEIGKGTPPIEFIFLGEKMQGIYRLVKDVAATNATVLITGPSGTGKELVARVIHMVSPRRDKPFVAVHCAALAESVLESELFGHEKGSFTGASTLRKGRFEAAYGGTIFLDEIGDVSPAVQVKLLRVLQERVVERVGGSTSIDVDVRVLAATNRDLKKEMEERRFREDLFYRLNVFPIELPPLVERQDALVAIAEYFVNKHSALLGKRGCYLTDSAKDMLLKYHWPGNIRELQNVIERAVILSRGAIEPSHLNLSDSAPHCQSTGGNALEDIEREAIRNALLKTGGNKKKAAELLGIARRTLHYKLKELGDIN